MSHRVAIITRTKNRSILLRRALISVAQQTYSNYVHVIVNDGGNRDEVERTISNTLKSRERVQVIHNESSLGMEAASNAGIDASQSDYVVIHDDDDSWQEDFLQKSVGYLTTFTDDEGVVTGSYKVIERIRDEKVEIFRVRPYTHLRSGIYLHELCETNLFPPISFLYKRRTLTAIGLYNPKMRVQGDWEFNLRFLSEFQVGFIPDLLANYHHRESSAGPMGNTVTAGRDLHYHQRRLITDQMLRSKMLSDKPAIAVLANLRYSRQSEIGKLRLTDSIKRALKSFPLLRIVRDRKWESHRCRLNKRFS